jgi:glutaredoxin
MGKFINKIIKYKNTDLYVVFYSTECSYSMNLINFLKNNKIKFKAYDVDKSNNFQKLLDDLNKHNKLVNFNVTHKTKPIVFYKGTYFGDSNTTIKLLS